MKIINFKIIILITIILSSCNGKVVNVVVVDKSFNKDNEIIKIKTDNEYKQAIVQKTKKTNIVIEKKNATFELPTWIYPVNADISTHFSNLHKLVVFATKKNMPIMAVKEGKVVYGDDNLKSYGKMIIIKHEFGFYTQYMFTGELRIKVDDEVVQGEVVAVTGDKPFAISMKKFNTIINPEKYLKWPYIK